MAKPKYAYMRALLWTALAAFIILVAASCGKRHNGGGPAPSSAMPSTKEASTPPQSESNNPWDVSAQVVGAEIEAQWRGRNVGDYDLDGAVGVADITPIAMNFGAAVEYVGTNPQVPVETGNNEYLACVDGDGNGTIGVADITPIAQHFGERCTGYRVYLGLRATGETEITWNTEFETPPGNPVSPTTVQFNESRTLGEVQRYSFSFAKPSGFEGFGKLRIVATDGTLEGALAESSEFALSTAADTVPPFYVSGITGLAASAKPGSITLSWGVWEDLDSPPVDIEIAWGSSPFDPETASNRVVIDASAQTYEITGLTNDQTYEISCRFFDHAAPANATIWLPTASATPSARLYSVPPAGGSFISLAAGLSPSVDSFPDSSAVHDQYAPLVAFISAGAGDTGQLFFARYNNGAWAVEAVSADTFSACSIVAAGDEPVIIATRLTPSPGLIRYWSDSELSAWNSEVIYDVAISNMKTYQNSENLQHPYVVFTTGITPSISANLAYYDTGWNISTYGATFVDNIIDLSVTRKPAGALQVLITHGTIDAAQSQIDSTIACLAWEPLSHDWSLNGDFGIPDDTSGNRRAAFSTTFWPATMPDFFGAASVIRIVPTDIPFVGTVDLPHGDVLGMVPGGFGTQQEWIEIRKGTTTPMLMPLGLTLNWFIEPRWVEGDDTIIFVNVAGTITMSYPPLSITGGSLTPKWYKSTRSGAIWSIPQELSVYILPGRGHDLAPSAVGNFQMVYTQVDTIDVNSLLGGGALPTGRIFYARE